MESLNFAFITMDTNSTNFIILTYEYMNKTV
jgi:hypothetical protein